MHESVLVLTLTASLLAALVLGFITQRLHLSPIVGYLLAGLIVGPYTPGFVADRALASEFAEIGIVLLMFGVGLHFHPGDLLAVRNVAVVGALGQSATATLLGAFVGRAFGWGWSSSVVFGVALSVASTVMLTRVLMDNQHLQTPTGRIAIGWLVVEDIFTIVVLVLLPTIFSSDAANSRAVVRALAITSIKLVVLSIFIFIVGRRVIPRILNGVASTQSRELFTLSVLVLALGVAVLSGLAFGLSMALGAFLAGMVVGQSEFSLRAASEALPMRDAFAVLFFVSVGMLLDPVALTAAPLLLIITLAIILIGKPIAAFAIVSLLGYGSKIAVGVAVALAQIGEFSLILASLADQLNIFPKGTSNLIVAGAIVSLTLNPLQYRSIVWMESALARFPRVWRILNRTPHSQNIVTAEITSIPAYVAIIVGYGPIGRTVSRLLHDQGIEPVIVEGNLENSRNARAAGYHVVYGNAARRETLEASGIRDAVALIVSGPTAAESAEIIRVGRSMNPKLRVLTRSNYLRDTIPMRAAGADEVFSGEGEVALAMTEYILDSVGATPEQMDRERQRVREDVFRMTGTSL